MKINKIISITAALLLSIAMLSGCGGQTSTTSNEGNEKLDGFLASKEPLEMTVHLHYSATNIFKNDFPIYKKAAELTNITLVGTASANATDSNQVFNTMLMGSPLPDIIHGNSTNTNKAGMDGAMIPLEDLVKKYAPDINKYFEQHPDVYKGSCAPDGHLYYIPAIYEDAPAMGWFIRQDWLDKLGLQVPTTVQEYHDVLKAFRDNDPNGNGIKDEVPYFDRHKSPKNLFSLYGVSKYTYQIGSDNRVYMPPATEEYKVAIREVAKWYAEGLIDQEIFTRGGTCREELFGNNTGGSSHDWFSSTMSFNDKMKDAIPGFHYISIDPPANINGNVVNESPRTTLDGNGWGISKDNAHIAETMRYFNFWFTETGRVLNCYGIEGTDYTVVDGKKVFSDAAKNYQGGAPAYMGSIGSNEIGCPIMLEGEIAGMNDEAAQSFKAYIDKDYTTKAFPRLSFTVEENRVIQDKRTAIETYINENTQSWIMGNTDVDATWDGYINQLKSLGIDELISVYQSAYTRYSNN